MTRLTSLHNLENFKDISIAQIGLYLLFLFISCTKIDIFNPNKINLNQFDSIDHKLDYQRY